MHRPFLNPLIVAIAMLVIGVSCGNGEEDEARGSPSAAGRPESPCTTHDLAEAQETATFDIVSPSEAPQPLVLESITLKKGGEPGSCSDADIVEFAYRRKDQPQTALVRLVERTFAVEAGSVDSTSTIVVGEHEISKSITHTSNGKSVTLYEWERNEVYFQVVNPESSKVSEDTVTQLIATFPAAHD